MKQGRIIGIAVTACALLLALWFYWARSGEDTVVSTPDRGLTSAQIASGNDVVAVNSPAIQESSAAAGQLAAVAPPKRTPPENASEALTGPISEIRSKLEQRAKEGDEEAAFALFNALYECYMREVGGGGWQKEVQCAPLKPEEVMLMDSMLITAADAGVPSAQLSYFGVAARKFETARDIAANLQEFEEYKSRAVRYLASAANDGNVDAMVNLATVYQDGIITQGDPGLAYAYWLAASESGLRQPVDGILAGLRTRLTPAQVAAAEARARDIRIRCCGG